MLGSMIQEDDVILAKDSEGNEYFVVGMQDTDAVWSFDDYHEGVLYTWHKRVSLGDKPLSKDPEDCLIEYVIQHYYRKADESEEDYVKRLQTVWNIVLTKIKGVEIISQAEYAEKYLAYDYDGPLSKFYVVNFDEFGNSDWAYELDHDEPEDFTRDDAEVIFDVFEGLALDQLEILFENLPDVAFHKLYMYDHSGYSFSLGSFSDPWDSGTLGCFICSKDEFWCKDADWKEKYAKLVQGYVTELNCIHHGEVWGFMHASVSKVKENLKKDLNKLSDVLDGDITVSSLCRKIQTRQFCIGSNMRDVVFSSHEDSCWGFVRENYEDALNDYLDGMGLEFVEVVD